MKKNLAKKYVLLFFAMALTQNLFAQWSTSATVNNAVCALTGQQTNPVSVSDGSGGVIIAWEDNRNGNYQIYAQHILALGTLDPTFPLNGLAICPTASGQQVSPSIVGDGTGGAYITWHDTRTGGEGIYTQYIVAGAEVWQSTGILVSTSGPSVALPAIVSDGSGGVIISWDDFRNGSADIYAQHILAAGNVDATWKPGGEDICVLQPQSQDHSQIISDGANGAIIAWNDYRANGGSNIDIYAQHIDMSGATQWALNGEIISSDPSPQKNFKMVSDGASGAFFCWEDNRSTASRIYAQHIASNKALLASDVVVSTNANVGVSQKNPDMASDGASGVFITWQDDRNGNTDIYARPVNIAGFTGTEVALCTDANTQDIPKIIGVVGGAIVAWQDQRNGNTDLYAQRVNGTPWIQDGVAISTAANSQNVQTLVSDGTGGAIFTWGDGRSLSNTSDIYAQNIKSDGTPLPLSLVSFTGKLEGNQINLSWQTASEQNTSKFGIEYSTNETFTNIGTVVAAGNSSSTKNYSFMHRSPEKGNNYYRLKMTDADGQCTYSPVVSVRLSLKQGGMALYPNPAREYVIVEHPITITNLAQIKLVDMKGRLVRTIKLAKDSSQARIELESLSPGTYTIIWTEGENTKSQTLVVE